DRNVTGVQTCALPICPHPRPQVLDSTNGSLVCALSLPTGTNTPSPEPNPLVPSRPHHSSDSTTITRCKDYRPCAPPDPNKAKKQIGRASCRERLERRE